MSAVMRIKSLYFMTLGLLLCRCFIRPSPENKSFAALHHGAYLGIHKGANNMNFSKEYPQYAAIEKHIRAHGIERAVMVAEALANFVVAVWKEIESPPRPAAILVTRRSSRRDAPRVVRMFSP
jgi:hypothetical protein